MVAAINESFLNASLDSCDHMTSLRPFRSFPSACQWVACVHVEGLHQGREMPSKIIFETEEETTEREMDTVAEADTIKVSSKIHVSLKG